MWLLTSPFFVAHLCLVSRMLRFLPVSIIHFKITLKYSELTPQYYRLQLQPLHTLHPFFREGDRKYSCYYIIIMLQVILKFSLALLSYSWIKSRRQRKPSKKKLTHQIDITCHLSFTCNIISGNFIIYKIK